MNKRGQVTLFVIIGVVIVVLIGLGIFFRGQITDLVTGGGEAIIFSDEEEDIRLIVQECFEAAAEDALFLAQKQSGHVFDQEGSLSIQGVEVPYIYEPGELKVITVDELRGEFGRFVQEQVTACVGVVDASFEEASARIGLDNSGLDYQLVYPFTVSIGETATRNDFPYTYGIETEMLAFIQLMREVGQRHEQRPTEIPINVLISQVDFVPDSITIEDSIFYSLETRSEPLAVYYFAARYE